jgi:hypothetical protein
MAPPISFSTYTYYYTPRLKCKPQVIVSPIMELASELCEAQRKSLKRTKTELEIQMFFELCYEMVKLNKIFCAWQPALVIR